MNEETIAELNKRMGVVIALLLRTIPKAGGDSLSLRDQIQLLSELGTRPKDIAEILGRTQSFVGKELTGLRKNKGKAKGKS
jgi:hypothetical protein